MSINELREKIDELDKKLLQIIKDRFLLIEEIGLLKKDKKGAIVDNKREKEIFNKITKQAKKIGLNKKMVSEIWQILIKESKMIQRYENY